MDAIPQFQPRQIVFLECGTTRLYGEMIQVISARSRCWVRPLMLASWGANGLDAFYDLRQSADLVWHLNLFQPALDTEVIPLLAQLQAPDDPPAARPIARGQLNHFLKQVLRSRPTPRRHSS